MFAGSFIGPVGHFWYIFLEHFASRVFSEGTTLYVALKVVADSMVECPLDVAAFFCFMEFVKGGGIAAAQAKLSKDFWPTYLAQMTFWPLYQWFNFSMIPVEHQLLIVNLGCILDSTFLCWYAIPILDPSALDMPHINPNPHPSVPTRRCDSGSPYAPVLLPLHLLLIHATQQQIHAMSCQV